MVVPVLGGCYTIPHSLHYGVYKCCQCERGFALVHSDVHPSVATNGNTWNGFHESLEELIKSQTLELRQVKPKVLTLMKTWSTVSGDGDIVGTYLSKQAAKKAAEISNTEEDWVVGFVFNSGQKFRHYERGVYTLLQLRDGWILITDGNAYSHRCSNTPAGAFYGNTRYFTPI